MHSYWLYAGRYYQTTADEKLCFTKKASEIIPENRVVFCIKIVETPLLGKCAAILEDYHTGEIHTYNLIGRPERINFVAINPSILN